MSPIKDIRTSLGVEDIPKKWYNLAADLPKPLKPPLNPKTGEPVTEEDLSSLFCREIIKQEASTERYIDIPEDVRDGLIFLNRPSILQRAYRLEQYLKTPAKIYFKREDMSPLGSHKGNTALAQAYYNAKCGIHTLTTETGAGQWGTALAACASLFDIDTTVFMVRGSYDRKPSRKIITELYGGTIYPSPSVHTEFGRRYLKENPDSIGSLGIAITEACEIASNDPDICYALGSVLNHVMLHQTVIGLETIEQMKMAEIEPDLMIACVGGGSNFGGFCFPMMAEKLKGRTECEFLAVESKAAPSITEGELRYDLGDTGGFTPMLMMHTMGHEHVPPSVHAGGLRYHGMAPLVSAAVDQRLAKAVAYDQPDTFEAGALFSKVEGIIPAPESNHAIKAAVDAALECRRTGEEKSIVFCLSGHGLLDLHGYSEHLSGMLRSSL